MKTLIYLHGFISSPQSQKALDVTEYIAANNFAVEFICPQLEDHPRQAKIQLSELVQQQDVKPALIGSSLGGFYASWLAEQHGLKAVLVNPVVNPHKLLSGSDEEHSANGDGLSSIAVICNQLLEKMVAQVQTTKTFKKTFFVSTK